MPDSTTRYTFPPSRRIKASLSFTQVFGARTSSADSHLLVFARPNGLTGCRLGLSIGKRLGNAVRRNRYKRTIRAAFRLSQHDLPPGYDLVVIPRPQDRPQSALYRRSLLSLAAKLDRRWRKHNPTDTGHEPT